MATKEDQRRQDVGRALLSSAEQVAKERGCKYAFADTMDYQAPGFWENVGYKVAARLMIGIHTGIGSFISRKS